MNTKPVRWSEGMLMLPHHFQAAEAHLTEVAATTQAWLNPFGYGLQSIDLNLDALAGFEVRINRLQARMKDGTLLCAPENTNLPALDLKQPMSDKSEIYLHLVLPDLVPGQANTSLRSEDRATRYLLGETKWEEVHEGDNPQSVDILRYNASLAATATRNGPKNCQSLLIAKIKRSLEADSAPELDDQYFPPLLNCHSWPHLRERILATIQSQLGSYIHLQADYLRVHGGWSEGNQPQIRKAIRQLDAANTSFPELAQIIEAPGTHPRTAYFALCRLVGQLAVLREDWIVPRLPLYDHEDLARVFYAVKREIDVALAAEGPSSKVQRFPFESRGEWLEVQLDKQWLQPQFEFFIGVRSDLEAERLEQLFSSRWLDWKLGSSRTIKQIYTNAEAGLSIKRVVGVHETLPVLKDLTFFAVRKGGPYWDQVSESRTLALKVNDRYITDQQSGSNVMTVVDPKNIPRDLRLELFILKND
jgi:type VI secretion system protein ImpJ